MAEKLTPWFGVNAQPARVGVYEVELHPAWHTSKAFSLWDGKRFNWVCSDEPSEAEAMGGEPGCGQEVRRWRGLAEQPK